MQNISKRALSWLVVLAMVLSMVPVFDLSNFAIASNAAEEVTAGQANLPEGTQDIIDAAKEIQDADLAAHIAAGTCPVCGDGITWVTKTNNSESWDIGIAATDTSYHFYLDGSNANAETGLIYSGHYNFAQTKAEGQTLCIAMINNPTVDLDGYIRNSKANCEINIMGQGTIKSDGKKADGVTDASEDLGLILLQGGNSVINLYGGTYIYTGEGDGTPNDACPDSGVISMRSAGNVLNIFDGVVMGPETQDTTKHLYNVVLAAGTINMYGGTIRNGVTAYTDASGNVSTASGTTFNLYGGTIKSGKTIDDAYAAPYLTKAGTTGTVIANIGGNVRNCGTFNMYGGSLEDGYARNGGNGGGNLGNLSNGKSNILGGTIKGGTTKGSGDNINVVSGTVTIGGTALVESGEEGARSSIFLANTTTSKLIVNGGTIRGGKGVNGGNIRVGENTAVEINGGVIEDGTSTGNGGNIYVSKGATLTVGANGVIRDGLATTKSNGGGGGNVYLVGGATMTTEGTILNGKVDGGTEMMSSGGNISVAATGDVYSTLTVNGGVIAGGELAYKGGGSVWGGNIRSYNSKVVINGGLIYGGICPDGVISSNVGVISGVSTSANTFSYFEMNGGTVVGDLQTTTTKNGATSTNADGTVTYTHTNSVKFSGSAKVVTSYQLEDGTVVTAKNSGWVPSKNAPADISGLNKDASIVVNGSLGDVFTQPCDNAAELAGCFVPYTVGLIAEANSNGQLQLAKKPIEVPEKPAATLGGNNYTDEAWEAISAAAAIQAADMAAHVAAGTCPICGSVTWEEATYPGQFKTNDAKYHYYIKATTKTNYNYNWCTLYGKNQTLCLALLNGDTPVEINGLIAARGSSENGTINIMGNGIIINNDGTSDKLGLLRNQGTNPTLNLYGGTFIRSFVEADNEKPKGAILVADAGTVNIFEGVTIGPETLDLNTTNYNVRIDKGTVNLYGGTIQNGVSGYADAEKNGLTYRYSGNITMTGTGATFNMYGGTVKNGAYKASVPGDTNGGNILGQVNGQFINIYGGTIEGGVAGVGGNIELYGTNSKLIMMGGTVKNGVASSMGGNIFLSSVPGEIGGYALIDNGEAGGNGGGNVHYSAALLISGGVIQNGKATAASGASGGNLRGNGTLTMTGGTVQNGYAAKSATGGGNLYATGGQSVTISGGNWIGGEAYNGGNIYIYNGNLTVSGDAVIEGGKATNSGGNIFKYGGDAGYSNTNTHYVVISGNAVIKDGKANGANGGNICLAASKLSIADSVQVLGGHAKTFGGNIYVTGQNRKGAAIPDTDPVQYEYNMEYAVFEMKGGIVKDGTATGMANANIYILNANMDMSGGEVYAPANSTANGAGLRLATGAALYLSGDATIGCQDGVNDNCFQVQPNAKLYISGDWTGNACVQFNEYFSAGETIVTDEKYYATWGTFTSAADETTGLVTFTFNQGEGDAYTGTLIHERAPYPIIVPQADGTTAIVAAGVIGESGATWYASAAEALENYNIHEDLYLYLSGDVTINEDIVIDVAGAELTLSGTGRVYGLDSRNDGYSDYGTITIADGAEITFNTDTSHPVNGYRYIGIKEGNALSFHRIEMYFTNATLRAADAGIYYKATFKADELLSSKVERFGTVLSLNDMPGADFDFAEDINIATKLDGEKFVMDENGQLDITTASVFGIVKESRTKEQNTAYAQMDIYANLYLYVMNEDSVGAYVMAEDASMEETKGAGVAYSLVDILDLINDNWDNYSEEEKATVLGALNKWAGFITDEAAAGLQAQLDKIFAA